LTRGRSNSLMLRHFSIIGFKLTVMVLATPLVILGQAFQAFGGSLEDLAEALVAAAREWFFGPQPEAQ